MQLQPNTLLQGGKYRIEDTLGQGGFGITYLGWQVGLNRKVAIKEFFMKEKCNRDEGTNAVSVPSVGSREIVERFKQKFLKEAQTIANLHHQHIVHIFDIFEENGTAYYVMEYIGQSLSSRVQHHKGFPEPAALKYVRQVAEALDYVHSRNILHLDVKPSNIVLRENHEAVLIDFGISKRYDKVGHQTSSTPVALSKGYAPLERYDQDVKAFTPATDIYSLGATLYNLLTGTNPPEASMVNSSGLPPCPPNVSSPTWQAVVQAMQPKYKDRPQNIADFLALLPDSSNEDTVPEDKQKPGDSLKRKSTPAWVKWGLLAAIPAIAFLIFMIRKGTDDTIVAPEPDNTEKHETTNENDTETSEPRTFTVNGVSFVMVPVEGGTFQMGGTPEQGSDAYDDEKPVHSVTLSGYSIGQTEVTQELWQAVMGSNPSKWKGDKLPVEQVSWDDCQEFIKKLNLATGQTFRLPTETEWEFAARGGIKSQGYKYSGSNTIDDVAWYIDNSGNQTHEVATKRPNELELYDMSGNVWEWCQDWYGDYSSSSQTNPTGASSGSNRVRRGGSWGSLVWYCRSSDRNNIIPSFRGDYLGLRLALDFSIFMADGSNSVVERTGIRPPE